MAEPGPAPGARPEPFSVPFKEAIEYFRDKLRLPTARWTDLWQGQHARAFVVAGAMNDDLLRDFQSAILKAIEQGTTLEEFRRDFDRIVAAHGWSYKGGRNWRSRLIYQVNLRMAYAAGHWGQAQRTKKRRPYLRYVAVQDERTRPQHRTWHGTVLHVDHEWWKTHYPPNGWNCRCNVVSLSERDLKRFGFKVSESPPPGETVDHTINTAAGPTKVTVPEGIDPGFGYNPGEAAYGTQLSDEVMDTWRKSGGDAWEMLTPGNWQSLGRPDLIPVDPPRAKLGETVETSEATIAAIERAIGGKERVFDLPDGTPVEVVADTLGKHVAPRRTPFVPFVPELLTDPYEVWLSFERHKGTGRVELRHRVIKVLDVGGEEHGLVMVAQVVRGRLEAWTFVPASQLSYLRGQRRGKLLFGRSEG